MTAIRVAVFDRTDGSSLGDTCRRLGAAGYQVTGIGDEMHFADAVSSVNCAVVFAYELTREMIPTQLDGTHVPPIVLVSPLAFEHAIRSLPNPRVVPQRIDPALADRLLVAAVTQWAIEDILRRLNVVVQRHLSLTPPLRSTMRAATGAKKRTIRRHADSAKITTRTLEAHWVQAFGPEAPKLKDFCSGVWFLQILSEAASEPVLVWSRFRLKHGIPRSTLRRTSMALAGRIPSELDVAGEPGTLIAAICSAAIPPQLLAEMLGHVRI